MSKTIQKKLLLSSTLLAISALSAIPVIPVMADDKPLTIREQAPRQAYQTTNENTQKVVAEDSVMAEIATLQKEWARIKYQMPEKKAQLDAIHRLEAQAAEVALKYPDRAEPKIWEGIILSTDAGIVKGLSALGKVKKAKMLFETSLNQNPRALEGSAHTSLGSLYYQVPGWPLGFGDDKEAERHLIMALQINPNGIDSNFFYGDFLLQNGRHQEAKKYFEKAMMAPNRPDRPLADAGRRQEIKAKLADIDQKHKDNEK